MEQDDRCFVCPSRSGQDTADSSDWMLPFHFFDWIAKEIFSGKGGMIRANPDFRAQDQCNKPKMVVSSRRPTDFHRSRQDLCLLRLDQNGQ